MNPLKKEPTALKALVACPLKAAPTCISCPCIVPLIDGGKLFADVLPRTMPFKLEAILVILPATTLLTNTCLILSVERFLTTDLTLYISLYFVGAILSERVITTFDLGY